MARDQGIDVSGPYPPDTIFLRAKQGGFDAVVAMFRLREGMARLVRNPIPGTEFTAGPTFEMGATA